MADQPVTTRASRLALIVALLALLLALLAALAGLGSRWGLWPFRTGFTLLRLSTYGAITLAVLAGIALYLTRPGAARRGFALAALGLVVAIALLGNALYWRTRAGNVPPIHDITTDPENPPQFAAIAPLRANAPNPMEYGGAEVAAQQREAYPDIRPLLLELPPERAFQRALDTARDMGWKIVAADPAAGRIEATDQTFWFGFKDDVVIRLTPANGRTVVDVRSLSRVGRSDVGTNARRIRKYLEEVGG